MIRGLSFVFLELLCASQASAQISPILSGTGNPQGLTFDSQGNLYITQLSLYSIDKWNPSTQQLSTVAIGNFPTVGFTGLNDVRGIAVDAQGNVYVADSGYEA